MTRSQTIGMSLATVLILFLADSTASAQGRCGYLRAPIQRAPSYPPASALVRYQEAYAMYLENQQTAARTYFAMRKENREARLEEKKAYLGSLDARYNRWMAYKAYREEQLPELREFMQEYAEHLAKLAAPKRLSPSELDPATGAITWPLVLAEPEFNRYRPQIESFFSQRSQPSFKPSLGAYQDVLNTIRGMRAKLKSRVYYTEPFLYVGGPKFLDSLAHEARFTADTAVGKLAAK